MIFRQSSKRSEKMWVVKWCKQPLKISSLVSRRSAIFFMVDLSIEYANIFWFLDEHLSFIGFIAEINLCRWKTAHTGRRSFGRSGAKVAARCDLSCYDLHRIIINAMSDGRSKPFEFIFDSENVRATRVGCSRDLQSSEDSWSFNSVRCLSSGFI